MKTSRVPTSNTSGGTSHEKPYEAPESGPGWIRTSTTRGDDSGLGQPQNAPQTTGATGIVSPETVGLPQVSLEDRLAVAISARGHQRIGQFIENARAAIRPKGPFTYRGSDWPSDAPGLFYLSDEELVAALEEAATR